MKRRKKPFSSIFWRPYQGLWNKDLVNILKKVAPISIIHRALTGGIVIIDSFILIARVLFRRISKVGLTKLCSKVKVPKNLTIHYFDLGLNKTGEELLWMTNSVLPSMTSNFKAYGFEANKNSSKQVKNYLLIKTMFQLLIKHYVLKYQKTVKFVSILDLLDLVVHYTVKGNLMKI